MSDNKNNKSITALQNSFPFFFSKKKNDKEDMVTGNITYTLSIAFAGRSEKALKRSLP